MITAHTTPCSLLRAPPISLQARLRRRCACLGPRTICQASVSVSPEQVGEQPKPEVCRGPLLTVVEPARVTKDKLQQGPAYRSVLAAGFTPPEGQTLYDNFTEAVARYGDANCLGRRVGDRYEYLSYNDAGRLTADIAGAMVHAGLRAHSRVSVFGANSREWMLTMQACNRQTFYCVPLYDALGDNTVDYIIEHSESSIVFVSAQKIPVLAKALPKVLHAGQVTHVVYWGEPDPASSAALEEIDRMGLSVYSFDEFAQLGRANPADPVPPKPDDICTIMYTSGTTGTPKGVLMTHKAVATEVASLKHWLGLTSGPSDVYLSFLPLAHIYGRCVEELWLQSGIAVAYWSGDAKRLSNDIRASRPTIFCSVPRVFERFESSAMEKVKKAGPFQEALFNWSFNWKLAALKAGAPWSKVFAPLFDRLVFKAVSEQLLGGRVRLITSGGAPLANHIEEWMRVVGCAAFVQGYGLTESCAATFVSCPDTPDQFFTVGPPQPAVQLRLEAVPEMDYSPLDDPPRGEVLIKGDTITQGYYKNEEETRKVLDADGWFHTGDVGELTPAGALRIIDRKKNIFKLSQGEYIAVEKIEGVLNDSPMVEQIWVWGSRFESCLVAVVVPARFRLEAWAREQGIEYEELADLCADDRVRKMLQREVEGAGKRGGLKGFELPRSLLVESAPFSVANDLMTPTFELRRNALLKKYEKQLDGLYAAMNGKKAPAAPAAKK